jgi:hypothetical protein
VDTYDVSGDDIRYVSTRTNRPDLLTVARVIKYASDRDYDAVLAYSVSPEVAKELVSRMPTSLFGNGSGEDYPPIKGAHEKIDLNSLHFRLERRGSRWVVVKFTVDPN